MDDFDRGVEYDERNASERFARILEVKDAQIEALQKQVNQLLDPIIRQKMLEPAPPIVIKEGEFLSAGGKVEDV